ncbi:MAG: hypothetical protein RJB13_642 [Pseudomonadota bacterium]
MMHRISKTQSQTTPEILVSAETLALLIPRLRLSFSSVKDRRRLKQSEELLRVLEDFKKVLEFSELCESSRSSEENVPFLHGLPRCIFQIEEQFGRYTNPLSLWREAWATLRSQFWNTLERSVPWSVKEILVSWRWTAELNAAKRIEAELQKSRNVVGQVHKELVREEKIGLERRQNLSLKDRLDIVLWSKRSKKSESTLLKLEQQRDALLAKSADLLEQCEKISAGIAVGLRTLYVDCGEFYSPVFEDNCRAIDRDIKAKKEKEIRDVQKISAEIQSQFDLYRRESEVQNARIKDKNNRLKYIVSGDVDEKLVSAEQLIGHEFYCLNALDLEKQDLARKRWKRAVTQMQQAVETAEESFNDENPDSRGFDAHGTRGAVTSQI